MDKQLVMRCCNQAMERCKEHTTLVKTSLQADQAERTEDAVQMNTIGFVPMIHKRAAPLFFSYLQTKPIVVDDLEAQEDEKSKLDFDQTHTNKIYRFALQINQTAETIGVPAVKKRLNSAWDTEMEVEEIVGEDEVSEIKQETPFSDELMCTKKSFDPRQTMPEEGEAMEEEEENVVLLYSEFKK